MRILYEALAHEESRNLIFDTLIKDIQDRPAYYLGGSGTMTAIGKTFSDSMTRTAYKAVITGTKAEQTVHELYGSMENFLNVSDEEFNTFVNNNMGDVPWSGNTSAEEAKFNTFISLSPEQQASWIEAGGASWEYGTSLGDISFSRTATINKNGTQTSFVDEIINAGEAFLKSAGDMLENLYEDIKGLFSSDEPIGVITIGEITMVSSGYTVKGVDSNGNSFTQEVQKNPSGIIEKSIISQYAADADLAFRRTTEYVGDNVKTTDVTYDANSNVATKDINLSNEENTYNFQLINQSNQDLSKLFDREYEFKQLYELGGLNTSFYNYVTQEISNLIVSAPIIDVPNLNDGYDGLLSLNPIGAFYESVTPSNDPSLSIADKTFVVLDSTNKGITSTILSTKDTNRDSKLTGTELTGLNMWRDLNENGIAETGEITTLASKNITMIRGEEYGMYTRGNAKFASAIIAAPTKIEYNYSVPESNFRKLRDTDNVYYVGLGRIYWAKNQVKINYNNRSYLIGTDGNDSFDSNYYAKDTKYFNSSLLVNFLAGGGNDFVGGSVRNDNIWGGTGADVLFGYAGDDKLYGEEGDDELQGQVGNDYLDGGIGNDRFFGDVGNDVLVGGDGNDVLVGFTATNDTKQTLLAGESDNDTLYGGKGMDYLYGGLGNDYLDGGDDNDFLLGDAGDDTLFGGNGDDELQGGDGNDKLIGEAGNDNIFAQTGDDTIWGGEGNDILVGFTASNDTKQTLSAGESDNDTMYGGNGADLIFGGLGNDTLLGESHNDELCGDAGNDLLYGGDGVDRLFGQVGDDVLYGGDGDDVIVGFTGANETKQTLVAGESDNDMLYGGAGHDILLGGLGNDYLDGGAGADDMQGGVGNDTYIVNSVNDTILEHTNEGYDTVISSSNYILNYGIEELRLIEGLEIHGTGNALDNKIVGNNRNNIIDGVTGADTMIGARGNDTYYVDNAGDKIIELFGEGNDTVQSTISFTLGSNVENIVLLDFSKAEKGLVDGEAILVYGYPKMNELDYMQGDAIANYQGTCALTAIANLLTQVDQATSEAEVVQLAIDNSWTVTDASLPAYVRGGSNYVQQQAILDSYGMRNDLLMGYNENGIANLIKSGRGVILALNAGKLWDDAAYVDSGSVNHVVTITGAAYSESTGALTGFYIADSGRQKVSDMTRYVGIDKFREAANVPNAYAIYTIEPLKMWDEDIDATGNALDNTIIGNRGDNILMGGAGDDTLNGGAGKDTLSGGVGNDTLIYNAEAIKLDGGAGVDTLRASGGVTINFNVSVISHIEKIDLSTDTAANTLNIRALDILSAAETNVFKSTMNKHQLLINAEENDTVNIDTRGWRSTGSLNVEGHIYTIYNNIDYHAQLLIENTARVKSVL